MVDQAQCRNREFRVFTYQPVDRVPDMEFGFWPQTVRAWVKEGFPQEMVDRMGEAMFHPLFDEFIGQDISEPVAGIPSTCQMHPYFEVEVLEDTGDIQIVRTGDGSVQRQWKQGRSEASIPEHLSFPVTDRASWDEFKQRFRLDDPVRVVPASAIEDARRVAAQGGAVSYMCWGFYGALRYWVGTENLSYLFHDDPGLVAEMMDHWVQLVLHNISQVPDDVPLHSWLWWEDMCYNAGPLISPHHFDQFMVPRYRELLQEAARHGCRLSTVDCDGNIHALVSGWLKAGVNVMFPLEVASHTDMYALRRQYGPEVRLRGGIDKQAIAAGPDSIRRELDRIAPMLQQGGYIPHLDHLVPPDISLKDYMFYREQKKLLIGKR